MPAKLKEATALLALIAAAAIGAQTAKADQQKTAQDIQVSWEGRAEIQVTPNDEGDWSLKVRLTGNVVGRGKNLAFKTDCLTYQMAEKLVSLEAANDGGVQLKFQMSQEGPTLRLAARKIVISLTDGRITVDGAGTLSALPGKPPPHAGPGETDSR